MGDGGLFYDIVEVAVDAEHQQKGLCMTRIKGRMPPRSQTDEDFALKISKLNLQVDTIANGHGWIGTMAEFLRHVESASR